MTQSQILPVEETLGKLVHDLRYLNEVEEKKQQNQQNGSDYLQGKDQILNAISSLEKKNQELALKLVESEKRNQELNDRFNSFEADLRKPNLAAQNTSFKTPERKAFETMMQIGERNLNYDTERKYLRTDINEQGGFLVPEDYSQEITKYVVEMSPIASLARTITVANKLTRSSVRTGIPTVYMTGEGSSMSASQSVYGSNLLDVKKMTAKVPFTIEELSWARPNLANEISRDVAEALAQKEGQQSLKGNGGANELEGIMNNSSIQSILTTGSGSKLTALSLRQVTGRIKESYSTAASCAYVFNRLTLSDIYSLQDTTGRFLWEDSSSPTRPATLNGYRYFTCPDMDNIGTGTYPVLFGDFRSGYTIGRANGVTFIRDDYSSLESGIINFYYYQYVGGIVTVPEAFCKIQTVA